MIIVEAYPIRSCEYCEIRWQGSASCPLCSLLAWRASEDGIAGQAVDRTRTRRRLAIELQHKRDELAYYEGDGDDGY